MELVFMGYQTLFCLKTLVHNFLNLVTLCQTSFSLCKFYTIPDITFLNAWDKLNKYVYTQKKETACKNMCTTDNMFLIYKTQM